MSATRLLPTRAAIGTILLVGLAACTDTPATTVPAARPFKSTRQSSQPSRVLVTADLVTVRVGESARVALAGVWKSSFARKWTSDDLSIAEVTDAGIITGHAVGTTTVTVTSGESTTDVLVTVLPSSVDTTRDGAQ